MHTPLNQLTMNQAHKEFNTHKQNTGQGARFGGIWGSQ